MTRTHGMSGTAEYKAWYSMLDRCRNPKNRRYKDYGGRGIEVRFKSFEEFFAEVGPRSSPDHSVDRWPNNDGHYEPSNCRWATRSQQQRNNRRWQRNHCQTAEKLLAKKIGPGEYLKKKITPELNISRADFAARLGVSTFTLWKILNERQRIERMAERLAQATGKPARFWLEKQLQHDLAPRPEGLRKLAGRS